MPFVFFVVKLSPPNFPPQPPFHPMPSPSRQAIRLALDLHSLEQPLDLNRNALPAFWAASDIQFELALFHGTTLADTDNLASLTLVIKPLGPTSSAPADTVEPLLLKSTATFAPLTIENWNAGQGAHAILSCSAQETNLPPGEAWFALAATLTGDPALQRTLAAGRIHIAPSGYSSVPPANLPDAGAYTKTEADSRYLQASQNLAELPNPTTARTNLQAYGPGSAIDTEGEDLTTSGGTLLTDGGDLETNGGSLLTNSGDLHTQGGSINTADGETSTAQMREGGTPAHARYAPFDPLDGLTFHGNGDYASIDDAGSTLLLDRYSFSLSLPLRLPRYTPASEQLLAAQATANQGWKLLLLPDGRLSLRFGDGSSFAAHTYNTTAPLNIPDSWPAHLTILVERTGSFTASLQGLPVGHPVDISPAAHLSLTANAPLTFLGDTSTQSPGCLLGIPTLALGTELLQPPTPLTQPTYGDLSSPLVEVSNTNWNPARMTAQTGVTHAGRGNALRLTCGPENTTHYVYGVNLLQSHPQRLSLLLYIPSTNTDVDGLQLSGSSGDPWDTGEINISTQNLPNTIQIPADTWVDVHLPIFTPTSGVVVLSMLKGALESFPHTAASDTIYLGDWHLSGTLLQLDPASAHGTTLPDLTPHAHHATLHGSPTRAHPPRPVNPLRLQPVTEALQPTTETTPAPHPLGTHATDLQRRRTTASQTATGTAATIPGGADNTAAAPYTIALGHAAQADQHGQLVLGSGSPGTHLGLLQWRGTTTDATPLALHLHNAPGTHAAIPASSLWSGTLILHAYRQDHAQFATFRRYLTLHRTAAGTVSYDAEDNAAADINPFNLTLGLDADDLTNTLQITVTGQPAQTWHWHATLQYLQLQG